MAYVFSWSNNGGQEGSWTDYVVRTVKSSLTGNFLYTDYCLIEQGFSL